MPANRRRSAITAPQERWVLLGSLLEQRRRVLGYTWRTDFARERGVNTRLAAEIEKAAKTRVNTFMPGTLELVAFGYAVAHESMMALLRGETDDLVTVPVEPRLLPDAPMDDRRREEAVRPYAAPIWKQIVHLIDRGVTDPSGEQLGLSPADAKVWDGSAGAMDLADRAWLVAEMQLRRKHRAEAAPNPLAATA